MAPKKPKDDAPVPQRTVVFSEVDKAMFELQIADLNRKLARLRLAVKEYEERNEELQNAYDKLDEDRADIIAYLKKTLNVKSEENNELKDRVKGLEELRDLETAQFRERVTELERNFTTMKDQLTSENKLMAGKLNTLEEFRAIRDDLMRKFDKQEAEFQAQEMKYKRLIYDAEKKFIIGKDKLKKEMEGRLLNLAQDFQDASESRIAASTHRVIRENIALNNQLDSLLFTQAKVTEQNEKFKEDERAARNALEVAEAERDKAINKSIVQLKVIDQLTTEFQNVKKNKALHEKKLFDMENLQEKIQILTKENQDMTLQIRILEQNLHASMGDHNKHIVESEKLLKERDKYKDVIKETILHIQAALKNDKWATIDPTREILERKVVLSNILQVINKHRHVTRAESVESLISFTDVYEKGDLGFVPKPKPGTRKSKISLATAASQVLIEEKRTSEAASSSKSSLGTLKTVPSISVIPYKDEISIRSKESIPSFTVTSIHSDETESEAEVKDSLEDLTDLEKQLELSKLEIQKSILKDLAMSRTTYHSKSHVEIVDHPSKRLSIVPDRRTSSESVKDENIEGPAGEQAEGEHSEGEKPEVDHEEILEGEHSKEKLVEETKDSEAEDKPADPKETGEDGKDAD